MSRQLALNVEENGMRLCIIISLLSSLPPLLPPPSPLSYSLCPTTPYLPEILLCFFLLPLLYIIITVCIRMMKPLTQRNQCLSPSISILLLDANPVHACRPNGRRQPKPPKRFPLPQLILSKYSVQSSCSCNTYPYGVLCNYLGRYLQVTPRTRSSG